jgi:heme-degrading monooxygenase HmoA
MTTQDGQVRVLLYHRTTDQDDILDAYRRVSTRLAAVAGQLGNELLRSAHDPHGYVVLSRWRTLQDFQTWERGADHRDSTADLRPYRTAPDRSPFGVYVVADAG